MSDLKFVYFGGEPLGAPILKLLLEAEFTPKLVVTNPNRPVGRTQELTPPPTKVVATQHSIPVFQPETCKDKEVMQPVLEIDADVFVVVAYNHILPDWLLNHPAKGSLNVHPSLLPKYRGPNPIRTAILNNDRETGVSVMLLDSEMDHGPLLAQVDADIHETEWPLPGRVLDERLIALGGQLLIDTLPRYVAGEIEPQEQNHAEATYTTKVTRADGELLLDPHNLPTGEVAREYYLMHCAYDGWPETFFMHDDKRIKIKKEELADGQFRPLSVIPEGKGEISFSDYLSQLT